MKNTCLIIATAVFFLSFCGTALAFEWIKLHDYADTINSAQAEKEARLEPDSAERKYVLGLTFFNDHKNQEALNLFTGLVSRYPGQKEFTWGVAEALRRKHQSDDAERILSNLIKSNFDYAPAYISLAYIKYTKLDFEESLRLAIKVKEMRRKNVDLSNFVRAYLLIAGNRGMIAHYGGPLAKLFNGTQVLSNLRKAESLQPDSPAVLFGLGSFYFLAPELAGGDRKKAREYLQRAITRDPLFADAYVRLAQVFKMEGELDKYDELMKKALQLDPQNQLALDAKSEECKFICISTEE